MIIIVGIFVSVFAVLNYQTFFTKAGVNDYGNFNVTQVKDGQETPVYCNEGTCETQSLDVKLQIKDLNQFTSE